MNHTEAFERFLEPPGEFGPMPFWFWNDDLEEAELCYAPQYGSAKDVVNVAGFVAANAARGDVDVRAVHGLHPGVRPVAGERVHVEPGGLLGLAVEPQAGHELGTLRDDGFRVHASSVLPVTRGRHG